MIIDCQDCQMHQSEHCADCFVMALLAPRNRPVSLDADEERAIAALVDAGLAPRLRFKAKVS